MDKYTIAILKKIPKNGIKKSELDKLCAKIPYYEDVFCEMEASNLISANRFSPYAVIKDESIIKIARNGETVTAAYKHERKAYIIAILTLIATVLFGITGIVLAIVK